MNKSGRSAIFKFLSMLVLAGQLLAGCASAEVPPGAARAVFAVHCYDVGAQALAGRPGVLTVERGWSGLHEVDRVVYDPQQIGVEQLEQWLREAGTYVGTLEPAGQREEKRN